MSAEGETMIDSYTLNMFDQPVVIRPPDIRTTPAIAAGSESSRAGARNISKRRGEKLALILAALSQHDEPISREQLSAETGIKETSLCGRLAPGSELVPVWVQCFENACVARSGVRVNGYRITTAGRARVQDVAR
jgi:hypothetical protein